MDERNDSLPLHTDTNASASSTVLVPVAPTPEIKFALQRFHHLCHELLDADDWQAIEDKKFPKKSARCKLDLAFGVTHKIVSEHRVELADGHYGYRVTVMATTAGGRETHGDGFCSTLEKWAAIVRKAHRQGREPHPDELLAVLAAEHTIRATAVTRAKNRSSFDLYGLGMVTAEEIAETDVDEDNGAQAVHQQSQRKQHVKRMSDHNKADRRELLRKALLSKGVDPDEWVRARWGVQIDDLDDGSPLWPEIRAAFMQLSTNSGAVDAGGEDV